MCMCCFIVHLSRLDDLEACLQEGHSYRNALELHSPSLWPSSRSDAAAEMARQEQEMDDYNNAKQAQGDQRDAQRASNLKAADR